MSDFIAVGNSEPTPDHLPEEIKKIINDGKQKAGFNPDGSPMTTDNTQSGSDINVTRKDTPTEVGTSKIKGTQAEQSAKIAHTTQAELDHIADVHEMVVDNSLDGIFDKIGYTKNTDFRKEAIRLITDWHNKQVEEAMAKFHLKKGVKYDVKASGSVIVITHTNKLKESDKEANEQP